MLGHAHSLADKDKVRFLSPKLKELVSHTKRAQSCPITMSRLHSLKTNAELLSRSTTCTSTSVEAAPDASTPAPLAAASSSAMPLPLTDWTDQAPVSPAAEASDTDADADLFLGDKSEEVHDTTAHDGDESEGGLEFMNVKIEPAVDLLSDGEQILSDSSADARATPPDSGVPGGQKIKKSKGKGNFWAPHHDHISGALQESEAVSHFELNPFVVHIVLRLN